MGDAKIEIKPNYYDSFKCIASECKHNCCIGWEIDIDENTLKKYENLCGTLFDSKKQISKENLDAIEYFKSEGGLFTFITGRVPETFKSVYDIVKPNAPIGCLNGDGVYDFEKNEFLWKQTLPCDCLELVKYIDEKLPEMGIQFNTVNGIFFNKDNEAMRWFRKITGVGVAVENAVTQAKAVANYITVSNDNHAIAKIIDDLDKGIIKI